jgi:hypothetical protein
MLMVGAGSHRYMSLLNSLLIVLKFYLSVVCNIFLLVLELLILFIVQFLRI